MKLSSLVFCESQVNKLLSFGYLPTKQGFFLSLMVDTISKHLNAYQAEHDKLVRKYGALDNGTWTVTEENKSLFFKEIEELLEQEIDLSFPHEKITLDVGYIERINNSLIEKGRVEETLNFSPHDWGKIASIIKVIESEE